MSDILLDCLAGKLTNMDQITGYVSQLELKLAEKEEKIKNLRKTCTKLSVAIIEDALDTYDEFVEKYGESHEITLDLKASLQGLADIIELKAAQKAAKEKLK